MDYNIYYTRSFCIGFLFHVSLFVVGRDQYIMDDFGNAVASPDMPYGFGFVSSVQVY